MRRSAATRWGRSWWRRCGRRDGSPTSSLWGAPTAWSEGGVGCARAGGQRTRRPPEVPPQGIGEGFAGWAGKPRTAHSALPPTPQGCWGYLNAVEEIRAQSEEMGVKFDDIVMVGGWGGVRWVGDGVRPEWLERVRVK
jgi:hypothetical protein